MLRKAIVVAAAVLLGAPVHGLQGEVYWWNTTGKSFPNAVPANAGAATWVYMPDNCGAGGQIGVKMYQGGSAPFSQWKTSTFLPYTGFPLGVAQDPYVPLMFGTNNQTVFTSAAATPQLSSVRTWVPSKTSSAGTSFILEFDFQQYDCRPKGAPQAGATYGGTLIGFADFFRQYSASIRTNMTLSATTVGGGAGTRVGTDWTLYNSNQVWVSMNIQPWYAIEAFPSTDGQSLTIKGLNTPAPPQFITSDGVDTVFGLLSLSPTELYTKVTVLYEAPNDGNDYFGYIVGSVAPTTPPSPSPGPGPGSQLGTAWTFPATKAERGKSITYNAKLTAPKGTAGYTDVVFQMALPRSTVLQGLASSPKPSQSPAAAPATVAAQQIDWALGNVRPGGSLKVSVKMLVTNCTTPAPLPLEGKWVINGTTYAIPIKKPLYVTAPGCPPVPAQNKTRHFPAFT